MKKIFHSSSSRGDANHGWLHAKHSFSFANYFDPERIQFGALRVLNDDIIAPGMGFGSHPHDNMEIITIPLEGALEHKDSMDNIGVIEADDIQVMSAGTGVFHSEYNKNKDKHVNLLQLWVLPKEKNVKPRYDQKSLKELKKNQIAAYFGEIHPNILKQIDIKTESLVGFEIFMENLELPKKTLKDLKVKFSFSDYQKSERDFAFIVNKEVKAQDLIDTISNVDESLIKDVKVFDVYEGDNIPENRKSIAISVTIQSSERTLNENDLEKINNLIIKTVEDKTGAKIRS